MSSKSARRRRRQERILAAGEKGDGKFAIISPVEIKAIANEEGNPKKPATFEILAYNGGELKTEQYIRKFGMPVVIDLQGLSYSPSITASRACYREDERRQAIDPGWCRFWDRHSRTRSR